MLGPAAGAPSQQRDEFASFDQIAFASASEGWIRDIEFARISQELNGTI
jgi:hypothetical protein